MMIHCRPMFYCNKVKRFLDNKVAAELTISKSKDVIFGIDDIKNGKTPFNRIGIRVEQYDGLLNNIIDVAFLDMGVAEYATNNIYCNLTLIGEGFDKGALVILTSKQ
ncbi:unnamed protein product, partial [Rotaria sp. Silwood1]